MSSRVVAIATALLFVFIGFFGTLIYKYGFSSPKRPSITLPSLSGEKQYYFGKREAFFEGEVTLEYSLRYPKEFTVSASAKPVTKFLFLNEARIGELSLTYEGGRGYTPKEYIGEELARLNGALIAKKQVTYGAHLWTPVYIGEMVYLVAQVKNGEWLAIISLPLAYEDQLIDMATSFALVK